MKGAPGEIEYGIALDCERHGCAQPCRVDPVWYLLNLGSATDVATVEGGPLPEPGGHAVRLVRRQVPAWEPVEPRTP